MTVLHAHFSNSLIIHHMKTEIRVHRSEALLSLDPDNPECDWAVMISLWLCLLHLPILKLLGDIIEPISLLKRIEDVVPNVQSGLSIHSLHMSWAGWEATR